MTNQTDRENEKGQEKALKRYMLVAVVQGLLGACMLGCGIVATLNIDDETKGPPYFIGGYLVGIMALYSALKCASIVSKANNASNNVKKQEVATVIQCHFMLSIFMLMGCFASLVFAVMDGFLFPYDQSPLNKNLVIVILIGSILNLLFTIAPMRTACTYGKYFGIVMEQRSRGQLLIINTHNATAPMGGVHATATMFQPGQVNNAPLNQLQMQNQLLQQQLDLQRQLNQPQQYGGGFSPIAPPPPLYNAPPPPSYST